MKQVIIAAVGGAVVYFFWQMLAWMVLPIHGPTVKGLPEEDVVRDALVNQDIDSGVYIVPFGTGEDMSNPDSEFMKHHKKGPIFSIYYHKGGKEPMSMSVLGIGFLTDLLGALIASIMLWCCVSGSRCCTYMHRVGFVTGFGVFLALMGHVSYYNWMNFEGFYTLMFVVDAIVGWFLAGLIIAAFVKPAELVATEATD